MVLTYGTVAGIDFQVANGLAIGYFGIEDDLSKMPKTIGDWGLRTVPDSYRQGIGTIVAVPTNRRTRKIYNVGRIKWIKAMGFSDQKTLIFFKVTRTHRYKWNHKVASFVCDHYDTDPFIINEILVSDNPYKKCLEYGIHTTMMPRKIIGACQILSNIHKLTQGA